jgi:hypothetical protein
LEDVMKAKIRFTVVSEVELNSVSPVASLKEIARIEALAVPALGQAEPVRSDLLFRGKDFEWDISGAVVESVEVAVGS